MGRPSNYSTDVPARCQSLIDQLVDHVAEHSDPDGRWNGPLKTTFLLAMATPMIVLPVERIFKPVVHGRSGVADDSQIDPRLTDRVGRELQPGRSFASATFFEEGAWHLIETDDPFQVAGIWPAKVLDALNSDEAREFAAKEDAAAVLLTIRNALAHGGISYLDANGRHTEDATYMLGFASTRRRGCRGLRVLRVPVDSFQRFLARWSDWLQSAGVSTELTIHGPGYFTPDRLEDVAA